MREREAECGCRVRVVGLRREAADWFVGGWGGCPRGAGGRGGNNGLVDVNVPLGVVDRVDEPDCAG